MKTGTIIALVAATSAPMLATTGVDWLGLEDVERVLNGENITDVAAQIAEREFGTSARIEILSIEERGHAQADYGGRVTPDREGNVFYFVTIRFINDGKLEYPVHTRHFKAVDDLNHSYDAEWGLTDRIDVSSLKAGGSQMGVVVFDMPSYVPLTAVRWEGEFASATARVGEAPSWGGASDRPAFEGSEQQAPPAEGEAPPTEQAGDPDEYQPHWDQ